MQQVRELQVQLGQNPDEDSAGSSRDVVLDSAGPESTNVAAAVALAAGVIGYVVGTGQVGGA